MGSICWLLLALAAADVLELKVDDELAVQARAEFAKFDQDIAPADAVLDWAERSAYREQVTDEEFAASWVYATESSDDEAGLAQHKRAALEWPLSAGHSLLATKIILLVSQLAPSQALRHTPIGMLFTK